MIDFDQDPPVRRVTVRQLKTLVAAIPESLDGTWAVCNQLSNIAIVDEEDSLVAYIDIGHEELNFYREYEASTHGSSIDLATAERNAKL